ncbi:hypothetical protein BC629DRAFT_1474484 [Irpex lacteus]|nr:hypothetical protein BC629DRAFT_1474484 [Irpex lacteus]
MTSIVHNFNNTGLPGDQLGGIILCQNVYVSPASTTGFTPGQPIQFIHNRFPGIPLVVALHSCRECDEACTGLEGGSTASPMVAEGNKVLLRVNWPGCQAWSDTINVHTTHNGQTTFINKSKLACTVAKAIKRFYKGYHRSAHWEVYAGWTPEGTRFEDLILYELRHVSKGSYQPVLLIRSA